MIRRPPRSTPLYSSAASDVYKRQVVYNKSPTSFIQVWRAPVDGHTSNSKPTVKYTQECLVVDSVEDGTEIKQRQSADTAVIDRSGNLVMNGNNGGLGWMMCSVRWLTAWQEMLRFKVSFKLIRRDPLYNFW